jgi:Bacterial SH3 domain.
LCHSHRIHRHRLGGNDLGDAGTFHDDGADCRRYADDRPNPYGYANLRDKPSTSAKVLKKLTKGTKVAVLEKVAGGSWLHVKVGTLDGYVQAKLVK